MNFYLQQMMDIYKRMVSFFLDISSMKSSTKSQIQSIFGTSAPKPNENVSHWLHNDVFFKALSDGFPKVISQKVDKKLRRLHLQPVERQKMLIEEKSRCLWDLTLSSIKFLNLQMREFPQRGA